jgi:hypothetical protein
VRRLRVAVAADNAADVAALKDALERYKETCDRLEVQKQLLLHQVRALLLHQVHSVCNISISARSQYK